MGETNPKPTEEAQEEPTPEGEEQEQEKAESEEEKPESAEAEDKPEGEGDEAKEDEEAKKDVEETESEARQDPRRDRDRHRGGGFQRRIEKLEQERAILLAQLQRQAPPAATQPAKEKTPEDKAAEYINTLVEQRLEAREQARAQQAAVAEFQRRTAEVRAKKPDFDDVVLTADLPISPAVEQVLLTSEHGPAIMYELAKSPAELARVSALPPLDAAREIGRLEAKFASGTPPAKTNGAAKRPPAPPTSVNGSASSTRSLEDLPISEYKRAYRSGRR